MRETRLTRACISCKQAKGRGRPVSSLQVTALRVPSASCPRATKSLACTAVAHKRQKHTAHKRLKHTHVLPDSIPHGTQHTHTYAYTHIHTYIHMYTYMCLYTHKSSTCAAEFASPGHTLAPQCDRYSLHDWCPEAWTQEDAEQQALHPHFSFSLQHRGFRCRQQSLEMHKYAIDRCRHGYRCRHRHRYRYKHKYGHRYRHRHKHRYRFYR